MHAKILETGAKPKIVIFTTGGTILSQKDPHSGVVTPKLTGAELLRSVGGLAEEFDVEQVEFCNKPGSDLTLADGLRLAKAIRAAQLRQEVDGVVVLQGTDTMDEIPYLIHLTVPTEKAVVFTGAMKSRDDFYADAAGNVLGAAMVAAAPISRGKGVLVCFNETIFSAADLIKSHASRIDAFDGLFGPVGSLTAGDVRYFRDNFAEPVLEIETTDILVPLLKVYAGMSNLLLEAALAAGARGLVIEGYGAGNVPNTMAAPLQKAAARGIPVVVCTRCMRGEAYACYGYPGGGAQLAQEGIILAGALPGIKSRIKLIVMLAAGKSTAEIRAAFRLC